MRKTVVITGSNRGIGLAFVKHYLKAGDHVIATCRNPEQAPELLKMVQAHPGQIITVPLDINDAQQVQALAAMVNSQPIDILINNAGVYGPVNYDISAADQSDWLKVLETDCISPVRLTATLLPGLQKAGKPRVIFLSSKMGSMADNGSGGSYIYRSAKAALNASVKSLSIDYHDHGIMVAAFHPGWVKTEMGGPNAEITTTEAVDAMIRNIENLSLETSGSFIDIDGQIIPW